MHQSAIDLMKLLAETHGVIGTGRVLEVGSYQVGERDWSPREMFDHRDTAYVGIDIREGPQVDRIVPEVGIWPDLGQFSAALSMNTLEHCRRPWEVVVNIAHHIVVGGTVILIAPFMWPIHDYPSDYFRYTGDGLASLMDNAGLQCLACGQQESSRYKFDAWAVGTKL